MKKLVVFFVVMVAILFVGDLVFAQNISGLESRVESMENYLETIQPTLVGFSENMQNSIGQYTKGLEKSLEVYSKKLEYDLENRFNRIDNKKVIIDPFSQSFQRIDTNTGVFLISVSKITKTDSGVKLHLNIGNPNFADYKDFKIKLFWGPAWNKGSKGSMDDWRANLTGAEFSFKGVLSKGMWNPVEVDISAMSQRDIEYIECEMEVLSVEMSVK